MLCEKRLSEKSARLYFYVQVAVGLPEGSDMSIIRGKRLLCATDLSHPQLGTERNALAVANSLECSLTFIHVLEDAPLFLGPMPFEEGQKWEQLETRYRGELLAQTQMRAETTLAPLRDEHNQFHVQVKLGNAENEILGVLNDKPSRFAGVLVGRHHHSRLYSAIFGSVAQRILEQSPVPVFILPLAASPLQLNFLNIGHATTMRPDSHGGENLLREMLESDPTRARTAHLAHCFERVGPAYSGFETTDAYATYRELEMIYDLAESRLQRAIEDRARILQEDGFKAVGHLLVGQADEELRHFAVDNKIDLMIFSRHAREGTSRFQIGRIVNRFVRNSPCAIVVV
jgi:nucleotide-binding universal stress UspA family protein